MKKSSRPALLLAATLLLNTSAFKAPFGIQSSGVSGSSFGGRMVYDEEADRILVTGTTTNSDFWVPSQLQRTTSNNINNCFIGIVSPEDDWALTQSFGTGDVDESCLSLTKSSSKLYIGGSAEEGGLLTSLRAPGSTRSTQYGIVTEIDLSNSTSARLRGGRLIHETSVQSVRAITADAKGEYVYTASWESDSTEANTDSDADKPREFSRPKFGSNYYLNIQKFPTQQQTTGAAGNGLVQTLGSAHWSREIATTEQHVEVADLVFGAGANLILAGSARGEDDAIPGPSDPNDTDGFVALIDPSSGQIVRAKRLNTQPGAMDRVEGICVDPSGAGFYAVGTTTGVVGTETNDPASNKTKAVLWRFNRELDIEWTKQLDAISGPLSTHPDEPGIIGRKCAVAADGSHVFVGGIVEDGAIVNEAAHRSFGKNDVWVGKFSVAHKQWAYIRQLGTSENEELVDLQIDKDGNILVMGNTEGSFMRQKPEATQTDVFVIALTRDTGDYPIPVGERAVDTTAPTPVPVGESLPPNVQPATSSDVFDSFTIFVLFTLPISVLVLASLLYKKKRERDAYNNNATIVQYLKGFDDVEVDLKQSSTGGWHGTYLNSDGGLRYYTGSGLPNSGEPEPMDHNAIIQDSLFDDEDEDDQDVPPFGGALQRGSSTYSGLVDAYNTTWKDLSPHTLPSPSRINSGVRRHNTPLMEVDIDDEDRELV